VEESATSEPTMTEGEEEDRKRREEKTGLELRLEEAWEGS